MSKKPSFLSRGPELHMPKLAKPAFLSSGPGLSLPRRSDARRPAAAEAIGPSPAARRRGSHVPVRARLRGGGIVGLDIEPGSAVAVQTVANGSLQVRYAAEVPLEGTAMPEGEVVDEEALREGLRELFADSRLGKRVRVGIANQRTVLRVLELPPIDDRRELDAAVRFQAEDQLPMPLESAVIDYHSLGIVETPAGPRQRVVVVAAQRERVERLVSSLRAAGLRPEGVDLSAFALIRALQIPTENPDEHTLYLNVGGLTNLAIAQGTTCHFTRVLLSGLESMAARVATRREMPVEEARFLIARACDPEGRAGVDRGEREPAGDVPRADLPTGGSSALNLDIESLLRPRVAPSLEHPPFEAQPPDSDDPGADALFDAVETPRPRVEGRDSEEEDLRLAIEDGVRDIIGEVRNSLDFHSSQQGGLPPSRVLLSGAGLAIPDLARTLERELGLRVIMRTIQLTPGAGGKINPDRLAVAAGLTVEEAPR